MSVLGDFLQHVVDRLPEIITAATASWAIIHQTNKKTDQKAAETNQLVTENTAATQVVAERVDGNVTRLNDQVDAATAKIDEMHQRIVVTASHTDPATQQAIEQDIKTQAKP